MIADARRETGLRFGLVSLVATTLVFALIFSLGPAAETVAPDASEQVTPASLLETMPDAPTQRALQGLQSSSPATFAKLEETARWAVRDGAGPNELSSLILQAFFAEFQNTALTFRSAQSEHFDQILSGLSDGFTQLKASKSVWCDGDQVARFIAQNDSALVPSLLSEFPYQSPQYNWAMDWMTDILAISASVRSSPMRQPRPSLQDEVKLQQVGLAFASEQWTLALQIASFANSEGVSYALMQDAIAGMDVCDLGLALDAVSQRLPDDVQARIWADLMPEIMIGNTPYVLWRVNNYFFIG